jgi:dipeptidase D
MEEKVNAILGYFEQLNAIPRCSKNEEKIGRWLEQWAETKRLAVKKDAAGNLMIKVPPTAGYENAPVIVIQGHMDMVCEKSPDAPHDFSKDPIRHIVDGDWMRADQTTLGADNGIAIALALALASDDRLAHPSLELLLTVDEESGLNGAKKLEPGFIQGRVLLNVDSETEGVFTVGCAGGRETHISRKVALTKVADGNQFFELKISGLHGGHSGIDIIKQRASANKLIARSLQRLSSACDIRLVSMKGGTAHNAIARDAEAVFACDATKSKALGKMVSEVEAIVQAEYKGIESALAIRLSPADAAAAKKTALGAAETRAAVNLLLCLPHGVMGMSTVFRNLVETSNNLATVEIKDGSLQILTSQRSLTASKLEEATAAVAAAAALAGASSESRNEYPPWTPNMQSSVLERCRKIYRQVFDQEAEVKSVHAGLECAVIGDKYAGMDMISFGPDLKDPHSPSEALNIPSLGKLWKFMAALLQSYGSS